jgi:enamine deaminase RidA (YjgF/YER057c/UK114 family)
MRMSARMEKLKSLGLQVPPAPVSLGSYVAATRLGNLVYTSGQLPMKDGALVFKGAQSAAQLCFLNLLAALSSVGITVDQVTRVIRLGGFVQCADGFTEHAKVLNGASDLCQSIFGEVGRHVRTTVGVLALPLDAAVEVEALFEVEP